MTAIPTNVLASVDLGSNSFRLQICENHNGQLKIIDSFKQMVRFAAGLDEQKNLSEESQERALECLAKFGERLRGFQPEQVRVVATNTFRVAKNIGRFIPKAEAALGFPIEVIAGREEARLIYTGVVHTLPPNGDRMLVIDIGGGSTELTYVKDGNIVRCCSIPAGSLSLWNAHVAGIVPNADELAACTRAFLRALDESRFEIPRVPRLFGTGGTIRNAARVIAFRAEGTDAATFTAAQLDDLLSYATEEPGNYARAILAVEPARIHSLTPGTAILGAVFERSGARSIAVSKSGVREGYLHNLLATRTA